MRALRPFKQMQLIEISDGHRSWSITELDPHDLSRLRKLIADRRVKWCLHPIVSDTGADPFEYDSFILISFPKTAADFERAKSAYYKNVPADCTKR